MQNVVILFNEKVWDGGKQCFSNPADSIYYERFYNLAAQNDIKLYRAAMNWFDHESHTFKYVWAYENNKWIPKYNVHPDLIFDKAKNTPETYLLKTKIEKEIFIINDTDFSLLISNKFYASLIFPDLIKKYYKAYSREHLLSLVHNKIRTNKFVIKPASGSRGTDVHILDTNELATMDNLSFPLLLQEFIESENGIPGIYTGRHDVRLLFIDNAFVFSYARIPKKGSYLANIAQGGSFLEIKDNQLSESLHVLIDEIPQRLDAFKYSVYSVDCMFDENQKPWIIEMNTMPGLDFSDDMSAYRQRAYLAYIQLFKKALSEIS